MISKVMDTEEVQLWRGDCREVMAALPENSVDSIVTDPPYELGFMGKGWDSSGIAFDPEVWAQALRVLKPGGHLLAFGGTRTWHRVAVAIEDAGFEIRDSIAWIYGEGMPKSKHQMKPAHEPIVVARKPLAGTVAATVLEHGTGTLNIDACRIGDGSDSQGERVGEASAGTRYTERGAVNIAATPGMRGGSPNGRFPANVIFDEGQAVALDQQSGTLKSGAHSGKSPYSEASTKTVSSFAQGMAGKVRTRTRDVNEGGASRFFYVAKAPAHERPEIDGAQHATVKPLTLMRYLVKLVTPPGGTVLEPFAGSGTTLEAAVLEGFTAIGAELDSDGKHIPLILKRLAKPLTPAMF